MKKRLKNTIIGVVFIIMAVVCGLTSFYLLEVKPELQRREEGAGLEQKILVQPAEAISLKAVLKQSEEIYTPEEKNKSEGLLWVDRKLEKFVVTLGAINGLSEGSVLSVYEDNKKLGEVKVKTMLDTISYVEPQEELKPFLKGDYYQVKIE